jgi:hypothetical protein
MPRYVEQIKFRIAHMVIGVSADFAKRGLNNPTLPDFVDECRRTHEFAGILSDVPGLLFFVDPILDELVIKIPRRTLQ